MRNSARNTRRMTAITLAAALCVAVYLNWEYAKPAKSGAALETGAAVESAAAQDGGAVTDALLTESEALQAADKNYGEAQLVSVAKDTGEDFFDEARLSRSKIHDAALEAIQAGLKKASLSDTEKDDLTAQLKASLEAITEENEIETLIKAKGMADCICFLQDGKADITVMTPSDALTASQVAQIRDIVLGKCDISAQDITVVEVK